MNDRKLYGDNLTGLRFGRLVVKGWNKERQQWNCLCDCGKEHVVRNNDLKKGEIISCGCLKLEIEDKRRQEKIGKKYAYLKAIKLVPRLKVGNTHSAYLECKCKCGRITVIQIGKWGRTKSCGCYQAHRTRGEKSPHAHLTDTQAKLIRKLYKGECGYTQDLLAKMFQVKRTTIHEVVRNKSYKEADDDAK